MFTSFEKIEPITIYFKDKSLNKNKYHTYVCCFFLFIATFFLYGKLLTIKPIGGDYFVPVSYALNFQKAVDDGQIFPRWIITPRGATPEKEISAAIDKTPVTSDGTGLMYYCYLSSALAYPFLKLGMQGQTAVGATIFLAFLMAVWLIFAAGRTIGASHTISVIAAFSYLFSPWLFCNVYSRGGVAEAVAEGFLPLLFLGYAHLTQQKNYWAIFFISLGTFAMALAHNIFFLWGITTCLILTSTLFATFVFCKKPNWRETFRVILIFGVGILLGMCLSSWQWLPAILTLKKTSMEILALNSHSTPNVARFADYSGIIGWPKRYVHKNEILNFFYTIGWWTIPSCVLALFYFDKNQKKYAISLFITFIIIFLFTYYPHLTFRFLPAQFIATQGTYRLLSILSCLGAFALCFVRLRINFKWTLIVLGLIFISQIPVISFPYGGSIIPDSSSIHSYEINDYHPNSSFVTPSLRNNYNGELRVKHSIAISDWLDTITQAENNNTVFIKKPSARNLYLRIKGHLNESKPILLSILSTQLMTNDIDAINDVKEPFNFPHKMFDSKKITSQDFDVTFNLKPTADFIKIQSNEALKTGQLFYSFTPNAVYLVEDNPHSYIYADNLIKIKSHAYERIFMIKSNFHSAIANQDGFYTLEIPMIYNKYIQVYQGNTKLTSWCDFNHRINVKTNNLSLPIRVTFTCPKLIIGMTMFGVLTWLAIFVLAIRSNKKINVSQ